MEKYEHYNNPLEGDLFAIIPDKRIAFRGLVQRQAPQKYSEIGRVRFFSPAFYVELFLDMGVSTVIRLNSRAYDPTPLQSVGIRSRSTWEKTASLSRPRSLPSSCRRRLPASARPTRPA